jgi:Fic-DOC domain mobile mystery protein B
VSNLDREPEDATSLTPEEREGLIPSHVALRHELNELEQENILFATTWAFSRRRDLYSEAFARNLHKRMFDRVWDWAGEYRRTDKNIGVPAWQIQTRLRQALDDARYWMTNQTFPADEYALRFHHALVFIHPFPNGNGRWSRLMADLAITALGGQRFSWGAGGDLGEADQTRGAYIQALRAADGHDFSPLIAFARS